MSAEDYRKALKEGKSSYHDAVLKGRYPYLPSLLEMLPSGSSLPQSKLGLVHIPIELIAGTYTAGRQNAFAPNFMPLLDPGTEFATKWDLLSTAHVEEGIHDAILAYEYMNRYYVQEGNKRVSVLKYFGAISVAAEVIRIIPPKTEDIQNIIYYEFMDFYKCSQVNYLIFSKKGSYRRICELMGFEPEHIWTDLDKEYFYSFYYRFKMIYEEKGGAKLPGTIGDAILVYIELKGYENVKNKVPAELKEDLVKVWPEFGVRQMDKVELVMEPEEEDAATRLISNINKILPLPVSRKVRAAFIHDKTGETSSWTYAHELGRMYVDEVFGQEVETTAYNNVFDTDPDEVIEQAIKDGNTLIFTTTPKLNAASLRAAMEHPEVKILNCSLNISHSYIRTYYTRLYEAKVLTGIIAGALADNNRIGYIADYPIAGTVANINAFAIGAQLSNPRATVYLKWSSVKGSDMLEELKKENISVFSGQDMITPNNSWRKFGVNIVEGDVMKNVATAVTDWGKLYEKLVRMAINDSFSKDRKGIRSLNYWWGLDAGIVDVICSTTLRTGTRKLIELVRKNIAAGAYNPFEGELIAQEGILIQKEGVLTPESIVKMDWLAENIVGNIPKLGELKDEAKDVAVVQSIDKTIEE